MRQAILVILLVGAAFLGGAFVNGPGLQWAQTQLLGTLGFNDEVEIASVDLNRTKDRPSAKLPAKSGAPAPKQAEANQNEPFAPLPTVVGENDAPDTRTKRPKRAGRSERPEPVGIAPVMLEPAKPTAKKDDPKAGETSRAATDLDLLPPLLAAAAPTDGSVMPAAERGKPGAAPAEAPSSGPDPGQTPAILDALASFLPPNRAGLPANAPANKNNSPAVLPLAPSGERTLPGLPPPGASNGSGDEWAELGRKMKSLGVTRFAVEGEPGGRVIFSCLIPLAGKQAVSQRFEADGDDLIQAVQATLRRIALWRAAQPAESP